MANGTGDGGNNPVEPIVKLMVGLVLIFTCMLIGVARFLSSDGQTFQIIAGLVTGFSGALLMRVKPRAATPDDPPPVTLRRTVDMHTESAAGVTAADPKTEG